MDDGPFDNDGDEVLDDMIPRSVLADPTIDGVVFKRSLSVFYRNHARVPRSSEDYDFSQLEKALAEVSVHGKVLRFMWIPDIALRDGGPTGKPTFLFDEAATGIPIVSGDGSDGCDGHLVDSKTPTCFSEGRPITGDLPAYPLPLTWHGNYQGFMKDFITELSSFVGHDPNGERFVSMATSATNSKTAEVGGLPGRKRSDERVWMDYLSDHLWPSIRDLNGDGIVDHTDIKVRVKEELLGAYKEMLSHQFREFRRAGAANVRFSIATHGRSFHLRHETLNKELVEELESYIMSDCRLAAVAMHSGNGLRWNHDPEKAPRFEKYAAEGVPTRWQTRNERRIYKAGGRTCDERSYPRPAPDRLVASLYGGTWRSAAECKRDLFNGAIVTYFDGPGATLGAASAVEIYLEQFEDPDLRSGVGGDLIQRFHSEFLARGLVRARPLGLRGWVLVGLGLGFGNRGRIGDELGEDLVGAARPHRRARRRLAGCGEAQLAVAPFGLDLLDSARHLPEVPLVRNSAKGILTSSAQHSATVAASASAPRLRSTMTWMTSPRKRLANKMRQATATSR